MGEYSERCVIEVGFRDDYWEDSEVCASTQEGGA